VDRRRDIPSGGFAGELIRGPLPAGLQALEIPQDVVSMMSWSGPALASVKHVYGMGMSEFRQTMPIFCFGGINLFAQNALFGKDSLPKSEA